MMMKLMRMMIAGHLRQCSIDEFMAMGGFLTNARSQGSLTESEKKSQHRRLGCDLLFLTETLANCSAVTSDQPELIEI